MRAHSAALADALTGSFERRLYVDVMHGTDRVLEDLPLEQWSMRGDLDASVKISGSGTVVYESVSGESLVPEGTRGTLSPFRASLLLVMEITAGDFSERVALGTFRIDAVKSAYDVVAEIDGVDRVVGSRVEVDFSSLELGIVRRGFRYPEAPKSLSSCYEEIRRVTGFPVVESDADRPIPPGMVWEAKQGGRWEAVEALAGVLGGTAMVDSSGSIRVVPGPGSDPVVALELGENGTVIDVGYDVDTDGVYNTVVGQFSDVNQKPIYAVASETSGDLAVAGLYGEYTRYYSSEFVKTKAQADAAVRSVLSLSVGAQTYEVPIQCHINPVVELGDEVELLGWSRRLAGQLVSFSMSDAALMNVTLRVWRAL